jgi:hypothetical protein
MLLHVAAEFSHASRDLKHGLDRDYKAARSSTCNIPTHKTPTLAARNGVCRRRGVAVPQQTHAHCERTQEAKAGTSSTARRIRRSERTSIIRLTTTDTKKAKSAWTSPQVFVEKTSVSLGLHIVQVPA